VSGGKNIKHRDRENNGFTALAHGKSRKDTEKRDWELLRRCPTPQKGKTYQRSVRETPSPYLESI